MNVPGNDNVFPDRACARDHTRPGDMILALAPSGFAIVRSNTPAPRKNVALQRATDNNLDHENVIDFVRPVERIISTRRAG